MCMGIYAALIALFIYYGNDVIGQYSLAVTGAGGEPMTVAVGWELVPHLWPVIVGAMLIASAVTVFAMRRLGRRAAGGSAA